MDCTKCNQELDESSELTIAQINKYAEVPVEQICNDCLWNVINQKETIQ